MGRIIRDGLEMGQQRPILFALAVLLVIVVGGLLLGGIFVIASDILPALRPTPRPQFEPSVHLTPGYVRSGESALVSGVDWPRQDVVSVYLEGVWDGQTVQRPLTSTVAEDGTFAVPISYPVVEPWSRLERVQVIVRSSVTGQEVSAEMTVLAEPPSTSTFTPTPTPTLLPTSTPTPTPTPTETPTPTPSPSPTPTISGWRGEYYDNVSLVGSPVLVRDDEAINFNWGAGSPDPQIPNDNFSARWTRSVNLQPGLYRFNVYADDGVRVWLDGELIINQWHTASGEMYYAERELSAGVHDLRIEYYEAEIVARIHLWWERMESFPDWHAHYFANRVLGGVPIIARNDKAIDFDWGSGAPSAGMPADSFSARWTRSMYFEGGMYRFHANADDGIRVYVDDRLVIDVWRDGIHRDITAERTLATGEHTLRVEYYEGGGEALIQLWWERVLGYPDWKGEYWDNRDLAGQPTLTRNDERINFNWRTGSPPSLPDDNFSARWTHPVDFETGTYRFHVIVDDGVRLWVDDQLIIDAWQDGPARHLTADLRLFQGEHDLRVEYYEHLGEARIRVWWEEVVAETFPDWRGDYWPNRSLTGAPVLTHNDRAISFDWGAGSPAPALPADEFSARWRRMASFDPGMYRFYARADDGIRMYVDGELVLDEWRVDTVDSLHTVDQAMLGHHEIIVEYYEASGEAMVELYWRPLSEWSPGPLP